MVEYLPNRSIRRGWLDFILLKRHWRRGGRDLDVVFLDHVLGRCLIGSRTQLLSGSPLVKDVQRLVAAGQRLPRQRLATVPAFDVRQLPQRLLDRVVREQKCVYWQCCRFCRLGKEFAPLGWQVVVLNRAIFTQARFLWRPHLMPVWSRGSLSYECRICRAPARCIRGREAENAV